MWTRGDQIVLRYRWGHRLAWVTPVTVVADTAECIALYLAMGTPFKMPVGADGLPVTRSLRYEDLAGLRWQLGDGVWRERSVLWLLRPSAAHAIGVLWRGTEREFVGWYGNLQSPLVRTPVGFDSTDHVLDVNIAADRSWVWKDEDEFVVAQRCGLISPEEAIAIRAEGERVIAALEQGAWPFAAGWEHWQPDPTWSIPSLPEGWDKAEGAAS